MVGEADDGQEVVVDVRPHWWYLVPPMGSSVVVVAAVVTAGVQRVPRAAAVVLVALLGVSLAWLVLRYVRWSATQVLVTSRSLVHRQGVVSRRVHEIPLDQLSDVTFRQSLGQRLLGGGDLVVESTGRDGREVFPWLPDPGRLQAALHRQRNELRRPASSVAGELGHLDELRRRGVLTAGEFEAEKGRLLRR